MMTRSVGGRRVCGTRTWLGVLLAALAMSLGTAGTALAASQTATFSASETISVPPASNFAGSGGGDGWAVALTPTAVYNVFHHNGSALEVACHLQSDASACWSPKTITDGSGNNFSTNGHPGLYLDQNTGHLFLYATRINDATAGVVCIDTTQPASNPDPFCGFTPLTAVGDAPLSGNSAVSDGLVVGSKFYSFNFVNTAGNPTGTQDQMMCFDLSTDAACAGQPFAMTLGSGAINVNAFPPPAVAAIGTQIIVPISVAGNEELACMDTTNNANCAGSWPVVLPSGSSYLAGQSGNGAAFPFLDTSGNLQGFCLPTTLPTTPNPTADPCYSLAGATVATPANLPTAVVPTSPWNGPALQIGPRVYIPDGRNDQVDCFDYSTGNSCANFPKAMSNLELLYTVNPDPQRPTCIWVNADGGASQIQNFDAFTGGQCGAGATRVLASSIVAPGQNCVPFSYSSLQVVAPAPGSYSSGTVAFDDADGNPISGAPTQNLDATGTVSLTGLNLNTNLGLPQFIITLNGGQGATSVTVKLTWTGNYDQSCIKAGTQVTAPPPPPSGVVPVNTVAPVISGSALPGKTLTCPTGSWTGSPTKYTYAWYRNGKAISGAASNSYTVQVADEGSTLTCVVTASNGAGAGKPATSKGVLVAEPGTTTCAKPSGRVAGASVGPLALGMTRSSARQVLARFRAVGDTDKFCLFGGWGIRTGYPGHVLASLLSKSQRRALRHKIVLVLTANPFYSLDGVHPGAKVKAVKKRLQLGTPIQVGANEWYLLPPTAKARGIFKVQHGIILEVGWANKQLTAGSRQEQFQFLDSFRKGA